MQPRKCTRHLPGHKDQELGKVLCHIICPTPHHLGMVSPIPQPMSHSGGEE